MAFFILMNVTCTIITINRAGPLAAGHVWPMIFIKSRRVFQSLLTHINHKAVSLLIHIYFMPLFSITLNEPSLFLSA